MDNDGKLRLDIPQQAKEGPPVGAPQGQSILVHEGEQNVKAPPKEVHPHFVEGPKVDRNVEGASSCGSPALASVNGALGSPDPEELVGRATVPKPNHPRIVQDDGKIHILIGVTGSLHIATLKQIVQKLKSIYGDRMAVQVVMTKAAEKMVGNHPPPSWVEIWHDEDEWNDWHSRSDPVVHIELRRWADILLIAPCSANTLSKIAMGLCDNLLTNIVRAWNPQFPILIAPAMVSYAYSNPATKHHLSIIKDEMKWIEVLKPTEKVAVSYGGIGLGGMMAWNEIVDKVVMKLGGYPEEDEDDDEEEEDERGIQNSKNALLTRQTLDNTVADDDDDDD